MANKKVLTPALKGFEGIKRFWDPKRGKVIAKILPGEIYVTKHEEIVSTVLGSCISACIWDEKMGVGGMNHFMLPLKRDQNGRSGWQKNASYTNRYGNWAMEFLINEVMKNGGFKDNLKVKIFGGGKIISAMTDVGESNIKFALEYLHEEQLNLVSQDVGGPWPRKVMFHPTSGRAQIKKLQSMHNDTIQRRENQYMHDIEEQETDAGDVELF